MVNQYDIPPDRCFVTVAGTEVTLISFGYTLRNGNVSPFVDPESAVALHDRGTVKFAGVGSPKKTVMFPPRMLVASGILKV
jgi:hypothetical protein